MYARMMMISRRLQNAAGENGTGDVLARARAELYRGQCNCSYWHGAFGGVYLPHLRNAVFEHLIAADNLLERAAGRRKPWVEATAGDFNFDARQEVLLVNDKLVALIAPPQGGQLYELDVRSICHNLLATMSRRPEAYHRKVLSGGAAGADQVASIHDRVIFKQPGLDQRLQYDTYSRKSLLDHFYDGDITLAAIASNQAMERGDFLGGVYDARVRRNPQRMQVQMSRAGNVNGRPLRITKAVTLESGASALEIAYLLEGLSPGEELHFAIEFNFAGLPAGADDRFFHDGHGNRWGQLGTQLDLANIDGVSLVDEWLGIDAGLRFERPTHLWTYPIATVSQSEGGFELVHQSVCVLPHWHVQADTDGRWSVSMSLRADTSLAESRRQPALATAAVS